MFYIKFPTVLRFMATQLRKAELCNFKNYYLQPGDKKVTIVV